MSLDDESGDCAAIQLYPLVTGGGSWESLTPPRRLVGRSSGGEAGVVGDHSIGLVLEGTSDFVLLDTTTDTWSGPKAPPGIATPHTLVYCFTLGNVYARTLSARRGAALGGTTTVMSGPGPSRPVERYAFSMWGLAGQQWTAPLDVDLGSVHPSNVGSATYCSGGKFGAANGDDETDRRGSLVRIMGSTLAATNLPPTQHVLPPTNGGAGGDVAGTTANGSIVTVAPHGGLSVRSDVIEAKRTRLSLARETPKLIDLAFPVPGHKDRLAVVAMTR